MPDYSKMTDEEFAAILEEKVSEAGISIMRIPGVYSILSEYFNNEVLDTWAGENPEKAYPEDYGDE